MRSCRIRDAVGGPAWYGFPGATVRRICAAVSLSLLVLTGCRIPAPEAEKYFDREDPLSALKGFAYAVEAKQWDYAYESLTASTREEIGDLRFRAAISFMNDPIGGVSIRQLITSVIRWAPLSETRNRALVRIVSKGRKGDGRLVVRALDVELLREDGEWRLDLVATAESLARHAAAGRTFRHASDLVQAAGRP